MASSLLGVSQSEAPKRNQPLFRRFQFQMKLGQPWAQHRLKSFGIPTKLKTHPKVINVANETGLSDHLGLDDLGKP
ncbi:MAG: hypothetical protein M1600_11545 [Firmicutes bacterium]|nr:hypothetical protein [Bacillota bacterium]